MSLWRDELAPSPWALVMVGATGAVAILSLDRAFASADHLAYTLPGTAIGVAVALWLGRRSLALAFSALTAGAVFTLPALFARELTTELLPTPSAYRLIGTLLGSGLGGVLEEAAPVPPEPRYLLVVWLGALALGFLGAAWMVVGRPAGAVVTSLGVVAFTGSVGEGPGRDAYALLAVAATLGYFLVDGRHRVAAWARHQRPRIPVGLGLPTAAAACLVGLVAPAVLGADRPLIDLESALRPRLVIIKPLQDIQRQLRVHPPIEVMRVRADAAAYWRLTALDAYDGREWVLEARPEPVTGGRIPPPDDAATGVLIRQDYRITSLLAPWLPAAYLPQTVDSPVPFEVDPASSTLLLRGETVPGLPYTVVSRLALVDPRIDTGTLGEDWEPDDRERIFGELARPLVAEASTPLQASLTLERHFRGFDYDENVEGTHTVDRLQRFLDERRGYCEQFAATMTLMLRGLGVPARVGVGFLPGREVGGEFVVSTREAHAWVEALIPGQGWVVFDPTPGRGDPAGGPSPEEQEAEVQPPPVPEPEEEPTPPPPGPAEQPPAGGADGNPLPLIPMVFGLLALTAVPGSKRIRRQIRRGATPLEAAVGAFDELTDRSTDLGLGPRPSETQREFVRRVYAGAGAQGATAALVVARTAAEAVYGPAGMDRRRAEEAWRSVGPALTGLRRRVPAWRRAAAVFDPRTLLPERPSRSPQVSPAGAARP